MHSAECQVAAVVAAASIRVALASGPARLLGSDQAVPQDFGLPPADSDQVPASAPLARGLPAFHLLLHRAGPFHRGLLHPAGTSL